jgi:hypothetical protein
VLDRIADSGLSPAVELLPTELVLRQSCGCPPGTVVRRPVATFNRTGADQAARYGDGAPGRGRRQAGPQGVQAPKARVRSRQAAKA